MCSSGRSRAARGPAAEHGVRRHKSCTVRTLSLVAAVCLSACTTLSERTHLSREESQEVRELARQEVISRTLVRDPSEVEFIKSTEPKLAYYFMAKPYAQYFIQWDLPNGDRILISGQGDIFSLEGARVERLQKSGA